VNSSLLASLAVVAAYLIGAIPFGYLTALWVRGIDIRTVGSGNIGATNVGRILGFRFFLFVFVLDLLKGFLPTYAFPRAYTQFTGRELPELGVLVALATILGHNFPVYLKLRGGKGVATSLGALLALDLVASLSATVGFVVSLLVTRYVSFSSLFGGLVFLGVHFLQVDDPWKRDELAMSVVTIGLVGLLFARHRNNIARLRAGTEPKVHFRKKPPAGRVAWVLLPLLAIAAVGGVYALAAHAARRSELRVFPYDFVEVARVGTGHQRAERVAFADGGNLLAVTCPRYDRLVLYRVSSGSTLELLRDIELDGRPVAVAAGRDRLYVLERPPGDERHVRPGWWETFDFQGQPIGSRVTVGMYPDDLALTPDGRHALVLTSGRGEGDPERPAPALDVLELGSETPRAIGHLDFDRPRDDPARVTLSRSGDKASVSLLGTGAVAAIDLADRSNPRLIDRTPLGPGHFPRFSATDDDAIMTGVTLNRDAVLIPWPKGLAASPGCVVCSSMNESGLVLYDADTHRELGRFPLLGGALNLSDVRPMGLAVSPERSLLAVASRSGGVHLIAVRTQNEPARPPARR
jgi:glycerol-3-phosphate acyltransferase PlsY